MVKPARQIKINARFDGYRISGVERYAAEIIPWLKDVDLIRPPRPLRGVIGQIWEQIFLPARLGRGQLLWSPANTGPVLVSNQVLTLHDISVLEHPEWFNPVFAAWYRGLLPILVKRVKRIITDSDFSRERILGFFNLADQKVVRVYGGLNPEKFHPPSPQTVEGIKRKYELAGDYFLIVGGASPRKNLAHILKVWRQAHAQLSGVTLVIVGPEGLAFPTTETRPLPGVRYLGYLPDEELPAIYRGALALLYPSLYEGFGLPILEAMGCGTPVIASDNTVTPEVVGRAGVLMAPTDVHGWAKAMVRIAHDPTWSRQLRLKGFDQVNKYSWERTACQVYEILQEV